MKQCSTAGKAPFPVSSSRMRAMSSSASREWMTSGSPVSRAAAMWVRKPRSCASRGAVVVVIIEPGLADRDHLRMPRARDEVVRRRRRAPRARGADGCRPSNRRRESARRWRAPRRGASTRVEIVTMRADAGRARARHHGVELARRSPENRDGSGCRSASASLRALGFAARHSAGKTGAGAGSVRAGGDPVRCRRAR